MANYIKPKLAVSFFAISIMAIIPLLESKFFARVTIKRWGVGLQWDDFQGIVQPFSGYEAAISSKIYLEYDSLNSKYNAYAGQNNVRSWAKMKSAYLDYVLNHEQYHFNITEIHARQLNRYIAENPGQKEYAYLLELRLINQDLNKMQSDYDGQTNHGVFADQQRKWEYKIDSMLTGLDGWVTDPFSGGKIFFPIKPKLAKGINDGLVAYRSYYIDRYYMSFSMGSYQKESLEPVDQNFIDNLRTTYSKYPKKLISSRVDSINSLIKAFIISSDSAETTYSLWIKDRNYLHNAIAKFPNKFDTTGYSQIAKSFINSFEVVDTDQLWIDKIKKDSIVVEYSITEGNSKRKKDHNSYCVVRRNSELNGFVKGPFFNQDSTLILAYDRIKHPDSLVYSNILFLGDNTYVYPSSKDGQVFYLPFDEIPQKSFSLNFGYTLLIDSAKGCYHFYYQSVNVDRIAR